jgi:hypothetical protein
MNSLYWAHVPASSKAQKTYRDSKKISPVPTTQSAYHLSGANAFRVADSLDAYSSHLKEFDNWTRLNTLVSVLSYFETYLSSVVSLSIESDLGILYSVPRRIDGVMVLKYSTQDEYSFFDKSEGVTKGTWQQRVSCYKQLFKVVPVSLENSIADLEKMRKIRNNVAHAFGRDINETRSRHTLEILPIERLSEERLMKYMETIRIISKDIDKQLLENHIGEFELIHYYHTTRDGLTSTNRANELKPLINGLYVQKRTRKFCAQLIQYYEAL